MTSTLIENEIFSIYFVQPKRKLCRSNSLPHYRRKLSDVLNLINFWILNFSRNSWRYRACAMTEEAKAWPVMTSVSPGWPEARGVCQGEDIAWVTDWRLSFRSLAYKEATASPGDRSPPCSVRVTSSRLPTPTRATRGTSRVVCGYVVEWPRCSPSHVLLRVDRLRTIITISGKY